MRWSMLDAMVTADCDVDGNAGVLIGCFGCKTRAGGAVRDIPTHDGNHDFRRYQQISRPPAYA
ncbi:MAG: hypothetical protein ACK5O8_06345 [Pirellula sp.]